MPPIDPHDVPVVILCGGQGTRLREASERLPKPMVDVGGMPVLWHIMKTYGHHGFTRFVLALGYKSEDVKRWFLHHREHSSDFTLDMSSPDGPVFHRQDGAEPWRVTFAETGLLTGTGARVRRVAPYLGGGPFMVTYGDGLGAVDVGALLEAHARGGRTGTVTGVHPTSRYGELTVTPGLEAVQSFNEKPTVPDGWVNGGFMVFEHAFLDAYLTDDPDLVLEHEPLQGLARDGQLALHAHDGFWWGMDTYRDWLHLNELWDSGAAPWRVWD